MKSVTSAAEPRTRRLVGRAGRCRGDDRGATAVEFALIFSVFTLLVFGVIEFSWMVSQWVWAEKATQAGVRWTIVRTPVAEGIHNWDCSTGSGTTMVPGTSCTEGTGTALSIRCYSDTNTAGDAVTCDNNPMAGVNNTTPTGAQAVAAFDELVTRMRGIFPPIQRSNVVVEYRANQQVNGVNTTLGFVARPGGPVPMVTVSLRNMTYNLLIIDGLIGLASGNMAAAVPMPAFAATLTAEDMRTGTPSS
jgi:Flp pilus assembly pilin Flp